MQPNERPEDVLAREKRAAELLKTVEKVLSGEAERPKNARDAINERTAENTEELPRVPLKKRPSSD